jgi:hypothetical protein
MNAIECLSILFNQFDEKDIKIFASETETEWGTTHYDFYIWVESVFVKQLKGLEFNEYRKEGIVAFLDKEHIGAGSNIDKAIEDLFEDLVNNNFLQERR